MTKNKGRFFTQENLLIEKEERGIHKWISRPDFTGSDDLIVVQVDVEPGNGHSFHFHPEMDEVIYILSGRAEQWLEKESRILNAGDSVFIPKNIVHATFNDGDSSLSFLAILSPAVHFDNITIDVFHKEPWKSLK